MIFSIPFVSVLSIYARKNHSERYFIYSKDLKYFTISYTHSVNKGRVFDYYFPKTNNSGFILDKTRFVSYGAGIPEPEETPGAVFEKTNDGYEISNLKREVPKLTMAVGLIANHEISFAFDNSESYITGSNMIKYKLVDLFAPQTSIILENKRISIFEYLIHSI